MKKRIIILFTLVPLISGYFFAGFHSISNSQELLFYNENVLPGDTLVLSSKGDIYKLTNTKTQQITHNQSLIEPVAIGDISIAAVKKTTNYSSLEMFNESGNLIKTLFNGNSGNIDTMSWISDPAVNREQDKIAYVSDKDKGRTNVPDNALYVLNLADGKSTNIANPDPYSGGLAHPTFNPTNSNILLYDYYQYDPQVLTPYSTIEQYDKSTGLTTTLTFEKLNAYQESISPDGKRLLFLGRNAGLETVTLYLADLNETGITNIRSLTSGDLAYPIFSNTENHIYYLESEGNKGYDLLTSTIQKNILINSLPIVSGFQLQGNSSFSIIK